MAVIEGCFKMREPVEAGEIPPCPPGFRPEGWKAWCEDWEEMAEQLPHLFGRSETRRAPVIPLRKGD